MSDEQSSSSFAILRARLEILKEGIQELEQGLKDLDSPSRVGEPQPDTLSVSPAAVVHAANRLSRGETQEEILHGLLDELSVAAERVVLFLWAEGGYTAYSAVGFEVPVWRGLVVDEKGVVAEAVDSREVVRIPSGAERPEWMGRLSPAGVAALIPLFFQDRVPVLFYLGSERRLDLGMAQLLIQMTKLLLQNRYLHYLLDLERGELPAAAGHWTFPESPAAPLGSYYRDPVSTPPADLRHEDFPLTEEAEPELERAPVAPEVEASRILSEVDEAVALFEPQEEAEPPGVSEWGLDMARAKAFDRDPSLGAEAAAVEEKIAESEAPPDVGVPEREVSVEVEGPTVSVPEMESREIYSELSAEDWLAEKPISPATVEEEAAEGEAPPDVGVPERELGEVEAPGAVKDEPPKEERFVASTGSMGAVRSTEAEKESVFGLDGVYELEPLAKMAPEELGLSEEEYERLMGQATMDWKEAAAPVPTESSEPAENLLEVAPPPAPSVPLKAPPEIEPTETDVPEAAETEDVDVATEPVPVGEPQPMTEEEEAVHADAHRFARLLVAEIKLYNETDVEAGRKDRNLYQRLREDINRSREMYEKRVHPSVKERADYFHSEVVRVLALEDPVLLGVDYPGPRLAGVSGRA